MTTSQPPIGDDLMDALLDVFSPARPLVDQLKAQAEEVNRALTAASRSILLTDHNETAVRHFQELAAEADALRRLIARVQTPSGNGPRRADTMQAIYDESQALIRRLGELFERQTEEFQDAMVIPLAGILCLTPQQFEHRTAQGLVLEGFAVEQWGGGAGDVSADVIARFPGEDGRRAIIQCKHTSNPDTRISSTVVQQVSGVREAHAADVAYVMTTGRFTAPARDVARRLGVRLVDLTGYYWWSLGGVPLERCTQMGPGAASA
ncbi:restriction endonuclease [Streptomyces althioticus]|uniref:restriction endonuclease n=1 Tax=Streptomyces althioticus TaxID=83380 RepID=UPI00379C13B2